MYYRDYVMGLCFVVVSCCAKFVLVSGIYRLESLVVGLFCSDIHRFG